MLREYIKAAMVFIAFGIVLYCAIVALQSGYGG